MDLRRQLFLDYYVGGILHVVLKPLVIALGMLLRRDHDLSRCSSITVLKLRGAGSLAIAYPMLLALRRRSGTTLRLVTSPAVRSFAQTLAVFDEIVTIDDRSLSSLARDAVKVAIKLFRTDAIVDLEVHSRLTTVFGVMTCARNRVGFYTQESFWRRGISTHLLFCHLSNGIYYFYDQLAVLFGCAAPPFESCVAEFRHAVESHCYTSALPQSGARQIGIAPCCSDLGKERMLRVEEWATALERSEGAARNVVMHGLGAKADRPYIDNLFAMLAERYPGIIYNNHAGLLSPAESLSLLAGLGELYCVDSALLHFARLLGVNTTSFWGPTDPRTRLRPSQGSVDRTYYAALPCSPCVHLSSVAPCRGNNVCMRMAATRVIGACNPAWLAYPVGSPAVTESLIGLHNMVHSESAVEEKATVQILDGTPVAAPPTK